MCETSHVASKAYRAWSASSGSLPAQHGPTSAPEGSGTQKPDHHHARSPQALKAWIVGTRAFGVEAPPGAKGLQRNTGFTAPRRTGANPTV
jgi:hypothetical protein